MPVALLSLSNKQGVEAFGRKLTALGWRLLASGGTASFLEQNHIPVTRIAELTSAPEILDGRVKTLHPVIFGGILARRNPADSQDLEKIEADYIDLVAVNLYPFREVIANPGVSLDEAVENIDIGGVALIRAAAKNFQRTTVLTEPEDYPMVLHEIEANGMPSLDTRRRLAVKAFALTTRYDAAIELYLADGMHMEQSNSPLDLQLFPIMPLRYGENPHQSAELYAYSPDAGPLGGKLFQGKQLSYNNLLDLDAAWRAVVSFTRPTIVIVKHLSPCGIASADQLSRAYKAALASDPVSAFGSVIAANREVDAATAAAMGDLFVECVVAPGFTSDARDIFENRQNLRLLNMPDTRLSPLFELRSINQGVLRQSIDLGDPETGGFAAGSSWKVVTRRQPDETQQRDLEFAWRACQHVKSNAIVFAKNEATIGIGGGQPNRVDCVRIAADRSGAESEGAVMASDAFFPFPDSIEAAAQAGIRAVIQPGGSRRDQEAIAAADAHDMVMVMTGSRHFRH